MSSYEGTLESAIYEDAISNRQRRSLRGPSKKKVLGDAKQAQLDSGVRIRISRPVANQLDFRDELKVWIQPTQDHVAKRKSLGNLTLTVFDTNQQPLRFLDEYTEESLRDRYEAKYPKLFRTTPPIGVTGVAPFGSDKQPMLALTLEPGFIHGDRLDTRRVVAPELDLDDRHQLDHVAHVTLGQVLVASQVETIRLALLPVLPSYVQFGPAEIDFSSGVDL